METTNQNTVSTNAMLSREDIERAIRDFVAKQEPRAKDAYKWCVEFQLNGNDEVVGALFEGTSKA